MKKTQYNLHTGFLWNGDMAFCNLFPYSIFRDSISVLFWVVSFISFVKASMVLIEDKGVLPDHLCIV